MSVDLWVADLEPDEAKAMRETPNLPPPRVHHLLAQLAADPVMQDATVCVATDGRRLVAFQPQA